MSRIQSRAHTAAAMLTVAALSAGCGLTSSTAGTASASPGAGPPTAALSGTVTVFAAASLTGTFTQLGKQFEVAHPGTTVKFSFGASSTLAQQILAGAPADVFAAASTTNMKQVTDAGDAADARTFAVNVAEIAVSPGSAHPVTGLADLAKPGVKVALCQPQVPCGALAQNVLTKAGVTLTPVTQGLDVKSTLGYVLSGEADAAIVYVTDVRAAGAAVRAVEIPADRNATTAYPIATVKGSGNPKAAAAFKDLVLSGAGQQVLGGAGFQKP